MKRRDKMAEVNNGRFTVNGTLGIGSILSIFMSYYVNHSVLWAFLHIFCGWFYVIYSTFHYSEKWIDLLHKIKMMIG